MSEIIASIVNHFKNKASTTLFAVYFSFWAIFHSEGIICLLFTNQDYIYQKYGLLKNEYLYTHFFGFHPEDGFWWAKTILPFVLTTLYVLLFSRYILNPSYRHEIKYKTERKIEKAKSDHKLQVEKNKLDQLLVKKERNKAELAEAQKRQSEANPQIEWDKDYNKMGSQGNIDHIIEDFKRLIYSHNLRIMDSYDNKTIPTESLTLLEAYGLIKRSDKNGYFAEVTEKGWYFIRKHG